jgi:hypothetical protein
VAGDPPRFSDDAWGRLDATGKQRMLSAMLGQIGDYVNGSAAAGGFDRADAHFSRTRARPLSNDSHSLSMFRSEHAQSELS